MAATVQKYQGGVIAQPERVAGVRAAQSGMGEVARGMQAVGNLFYDFQDEVDTADAKVADSQFAALIQDKLYANETGYMYATGKGAIDRRGDLAKSLEVDRDRFLSGLSPAAAARAEGAIQARYNQTLEQINKHATTEGRTYLNDASEARLSMFASDAVFKPDQTALELQRADQELNDLAARNGWSPEVTALKRREVRTKVHSGIVERLANVDAQAALDYLAKNKDDIDGEQLSRLEGALAPMAKEQRGRRIGAAAAMGGISPQYLNAIRSSESGGNDAAKNPLSSATGRYQFIESTWLQVMNKHPELGLTPEGRLDPKQQELAILAFTKDNAVHLASNGIEATGGNLYAAHFLGSGGASTVLRASDSAALTSLLPPKVIEANPFLRDMSVADFKSWSNRKGGGSGIMTSETGIDAILNIEDANERDAALSEYNLRSGVAVKQQEAARSEAQNTAFSLIEAGGSLSDLSLSNRIAIGQEGMTSLRSYQDRLASGETIKTDPATYIELTTSAASNPDAFTKIDPLTYRDKLDDSDFQKMVDKRASILEGSRKAATGADAMKITEARTALATAMDAAGIDTTRTDGAATKQQLEADMLRWHEAFTEENKRAPSPVEVNQRARDITTPIAINPPGIRNEAKGTSATIAFNGTPVMEGGRVVTQNPITTETLLQSDIKIGGIKVPQADVSDFIDEFVSRYGHEPSPRDVIDGLIASGVYTQ